MSAYLRHLSRPPSQTWRTFVANHLHESIAIDFAVVPTLRFSLLYVFVVLDHHRRRILHVAVTDHPTEAWTAQQLVEALPWEPSARFVFRDGDGIYGEVFQHRISGLELEEVVTARGSPWQNPYCERVIGTLRRECLDHVIAINERQLQRVVTTYAGYYNRSRTHLSLEKDAPEGRKKCSDSSGVVVAYPEVGGLHHRYDRMAA